MATDGCQPGCADEACDGGRDREVVQHRPGYGFIAPEQGKDVFVHVSTLEASGLQALTEGQRVEFEVEQDAKGLRAANVRPAEVG